MTDSKLIFITKTTKISKPTSFSPFCKQTQCIPCGDCSRPAGADDKDEDSDAEYMMFLQMTTKEKMETLINVYCAPSGLTADDYAFVAEMEELTANYDGDITKEDYDSAYGHESEVEDAIVRKYCVDPSSSAISGMSDMETDSKSGKEKKDSKSGKEKNKRIRSKHGK